MDASGVQRGLLAYVSLGNDIVFGSCCDGRINVVTNFLVLPSKNIIDLDSIAYIDGNNVYLKHVHISTATSNYDRQRTANISLHVEDKQFLLETLEKKKTAAL